MVGDGDIDWPLFLRLYHERCEGKPFIIEYVNAGNCAEILRRVRGTTGCRQCDNRKETSNDQAGRQYCTV